MTNNETEKKDCIHKPMLDYEDQYQISQFGDVWSIKNKKYLYLNNTGKGYLQFYACNGSKKVPKLVHRVVAETFFRRMKPGEEANHKDKNRSNNAVTNIQILTTTQHKKYHARENRRLKMESNNE